MLITSGDCFRSLIRVVDRKYQAVRCCATIGSSSGVNVSSTASVCASIPCIAVTAGNSHGAAGAVINCQYKSGRAVTIVSVGSSKCVLSAGGISISVPCIAVTAGDVSAG